MKKLALLTFLIFIPEICFSGTANTVRTDAQTTDQVPVYRPSLGGSLGSSNPNAYFRLSLGDIIEDLVGEIGGSINTWLSGSGAPSDATGNDGDYYLDTVSSAYYGPKTSGSWTGTGPTSLIGPTGAIGPQGPKGDTGDTGPQGLKGDTGDTGPAGENGIGVPAGGATGQILSKKTETDYDTQWVNPTGTADAVSFTPAGNIEATTVQSAIAELDGEKQASLGYTAENTSNKATDLTTPDNTKYATTLAISTALGLKEDADSDITKSNESETITGSWNFPDSAYSVSTWDGVNTAVTKNSFRDYMFNFDSDGDGLFSDEAWFPTIFDPAAPGEIGGTTPSTATFTELTVGLLTSTAVDGENRLTFIDNTTRSPAAGAEEIYSEGGLMKYSENGVEKNFVTIDDTAGDGDTTVTLSADKIAEYIAGVSVAAPTIQAADPTTADTTGWYLATTSGDAFYVIHGVGVFTLAGSYAGDETDPVVGTVTPDPATHDGTGTAITVTVASITETNESARQYQIYNVTDAAVTEAYKAFTGLTINETLPADQDTYRVDVRVTDLAGNTGTASSANIAYSAGVSVPWVADDAVYAICSDVEWEGVNQTLYDGHYVSVAAWQTARQGTDTASQNSYAVFVGDITSTADIQLAFTNKNSGYYLCLYGYGGSFTSTGAATYPLRINTNNVKIQNMDITITGSSANGVYLTSATGSVYVDHTRIYRGTSTASLALQVTTSGAAYVSNCFISNIGSDSTKYNVDMRNSTTGRFYANSCYSDTSRGVIINAGASAYNNIVIAPLVWFNGGTSNYNAVNTTSGYGANTIYNMTSGIFTSSSDLHLNRSDGNYQYIDGSGLDLSADAYLPITDDFDGDARTATPTIGGDE